MVDEVWPAVAILAGCRTAVSMIKAFLIVIELANVEHEVAEWSTVEERSTEPQRHPGVCHLARLSPL